jgi:hypothetical protein
MAGQSASAEMLGKRTSVDLDLAACKAFSAAPSSELLGCPAGENGYQYQQTSTDYALMMAIGAEWRYMPVCIADRTDVSRKR